MDGTATHLAATLGGVPCDSLRRIEFDEMAMSFSSCSRLAKIRETGICFANRCTS